MRLNLFSDWFPFGIYRPILSKSWGDFFDYHYTLGRGEGGTDQTCRVFTTWQVWRRQTWSEESNISTVPRYRDCRDSRLSIYLS